MGIQLVAVEVRNFRSIQGDFSISLANGMNVLIGPNNSGKSNVLRALALALDPDSVFAKDRDVPAQMLWARPSVTLEFAVSNPTNAESRLLAAAHAYEQSVPDVKHPTYAHQRRIRLRVKYQNEARQEFLAAAGTGDRRGDDALNERALSRLRKGVRFVLVQSGEDLRSFLAGRFRDVLQSVLREELPAAYVQANADRAAFLERLREGLLVGVTASMQREIGQIAPEISQIDVLPAFPSLDVAIADADIRLTDLATTTLEGKGTGLRGALLVALLRYLVNNSQRSLVFAIEEPEAFLHPAAQRLVREDLEAVAERNDVTLLMTSHSPFMISRSAEARVYALDKDPAGHTGVRRVGAGNEPHAPLVAGLFESTLVPNALDHLANVPPGTAGVVVVEGYYDQQLLTLVGSRGGRPELLTGLLIEAANSASSAATSAVVWRARDVAPVIALFDHDEEGRKNRTLIVNSFGFPPAQALTYQAWLGRVGDTIVLEDLVDPAFLGPFVAANNGPTAIKETRAITGGLGFHYGLTSAGKRQLLANLQANGTPNTFQMLAQVLVDIRAAMGL